MTNAALLHPGAPFGQMTIGGAYTQTAAGTLDILLAGPNPNSGFNLLAISNSASLAGTLTVGLTNGFLPALGNQFQILTCTHTSGVFTSLNVPVGMSVNYSNNGVFLVVTGTVYVPAVLQAPQLSGGNFSFSLQTTSNQSYTIQESTNASTTNWFFVTNFTGKGSLFDFVTPLATGRPQDFFRVRQP